MGAAEDVPHRELATDFFPGPPEGNNPLGAYFPEMERLSGIMRVREILERAARRQGIDLANASPDFFKRQIEELARREPRLLDKLPDLVQAVRDAPPEATADLASVQRLADALEASPFLQGVERFLVASALRAQSERGGGAFREKLRDLARYMERVGISDAHLDRLRDLFHGAEDGTRRTLGSLSALTRRAADRTRSLRDLPLLHLVVPVALAVCAALGIMFFLRKKNGEKPAPPAIPDFRAVAPRGSDFADALLAFYRRVVFDAGLAFKGKVLAELSRDVAARRPELSADLPRLDRAFYEIWYGKVEKPRAELEDLAALLARAAAKARLRQEN